VLAEKEGGTTILKPNVACICNSVDFFLQKEANKKIFNIL